MRVTNSMLISTLMRDLNVNLSRMNRSQEQLSSGKKINRPSDDPVGLIDSLRLRTNLTELAQFKSNAEQGLSRLEATDSALYEAGAIMQRIRELTVQGANGATLPQLALDAISEEVNQLKEQLIDIGNSTFGGKYLFAGTRTLSVAFDATGVYQGNNGTVEHEVGVGVKVPVNVDGNQAFGNLFVVLDGVINDLNIGDAASMSNTRLGELDLVMDQMAKVRSEVGARVNRIELAVNRMDSLNVNLTALLSKAEDVDAAELITLLKMQENIYRASLSVGARVVQPSLVDFLR